MSYLGLDVGTSGCKAVIFNDAGQELAQAYREYPTLAPEVGWAEIDSVRVGDGCLEVIREAVAACPGDPVVALGISSQGEAFVPIGADGRALCNAMVSSDTRSLAIVRRFTESFGREKLYRITGHTPHPLFSLFKIMWIRENWPDVWSKAVKFYCMEDFIQFRLGVKEPAIAWPLASRTMLYDVMGHEWNPELLDAAGLDRSRLARPVPAGEVVGEVSPQVARSLGLAEGVKVVAGGFDQPNAGLGAGAIKPGQAMYATGTVECITPAFENAAFKDVLMDSNLSTFDHTYPGLYSTVAFSLTGGNILRWYRDNWAQTEVAAAKQNGVNAYQLILDGMPKEPSSLMVLPHFTPTGTPHFDPEATGAIVGLRMTSTRGEVLRALLEGVAFEMRLNLDIMDKAGWTINELRAVGGGARNRDWTQLKADVLGKPITTVSVTEAGCLAMAMLACAATTGRGLTDLVDSWVQTTSVVEPNVGHVAYYDKRFKLYRELYPTLRRLREFE